MDKQSIEFKMCLNYHDQSEEECTLEGWLKDYDTQFFLVLAEGFEERSLGILEKLSKARKRLKGLIIGRYIDNSEYNKKYRSRFEELAEDVAPNNWRTVDNHNDGLWVREAINLFNNESILLDISGVSNRGLFQALDAVATSDREIFIGYSEADQYWPKKRDWGKLKRNLCGPESLAEMYDKMPWLCGLEHRVELVPGHEGYDSAGSGKALLAFMPFKCARLGAILNQENYSETAFIAGIPRLDTNDWRLNALLEINEPLIRDSKVTNMKTFSYRNTIKCLANTLFCEHSLLGKNDVHLAILGSKLQTVGCWALSSIVKSITVVTSIPTEYYPDSFSDGIGNSWVFKLTSPYLGEEAEK